MADLTPPSTSQSSDAAAPARAARVTLKHVAERAGVSIGTVSDIVNRGRSAQYTPETQKRVRTAIEALGYRPARAAQQLRRGHSNTVGVALTRSFENPYYARLFNELKVGLEIHGLNAELMVLDRAKRDSFVDGCERMLSQGIDGMIVGPLFYWDEPIVEALKDMTRLHTPVVTFGAVEDASEVGNVILPDDTGGVVAADYLVEVGHRRIAFLGAYGEEDAEYGRGTVQDGLERALNRHGILDRDWFIQSPDTGLYETAFENTTLFADRWLSTDPKERPTALLCKTDQLAISALSALNQKGIDVPEQLSVMGFDNIPESLVTIPPLTTVDGAIGLRMTLVAQELAQLLDRGAVERAVTNQFPSPSLVIRQSVKNVY